MDIQNALVSLLNQLEKIVTMIKLPSLFMLKIVLMELIDGSIELTVQSARSEGSLLVCDSNQRRPMCVDGFGDSH